MSHRTVLSRIAAALALHFLLLACSKTPEPTGAAPPSSSVAPDPTARKKVTKPDCAAWAAHAVDVIVTDWNASANDCPQAERDALAKKLQVERATMSNAALSLCGSHVGDDYLVKDGACYLGAKSVTTLKSCQLAPMTSPDDSDLTAELKALRAACEAKAGKRGTAL